MQSEKDKLKAEARRRAQGRKPKYIPVRTYAEDGTLATKVCSRCSRNLPADQYNKHATYKDGHTHHCKDCISEKWHEKIADRRIPYLLHRLKTTAKKYSVPFDLTVNDIVIPSHCPVFGIELSFGGDRNSSPSVDRIIPSRGYVKGNIVVVSYRANRIKNDATIDELNKVAQFYAELTNGDV